MSALCWETERGSEGREKESEQGTCGVFAGNLRQCHPSNSISCHQSSNFTLALHPAPGLPPPSPAALDGAAWWENDIQSAVRPIQAKLANDSSPPLRFRGSERYHRHHPSCLSLPKAVGGRKRGGGGGGGRVSTGGRRARTGEAEEWTEVG